ncbi:MAG: RNA polymerase sigma-70 factor, partial [Alistipes sp.]|nr:RNA polymerase sigma-70 factor [Alistipes sp.]
MYPETPRPGEVLDMAAFDRLFGEYRPRFLRFAAGYVADPAEAEDIVMESFVAAWRHRETLTVETFPPYTLTIVKNKCLNRLRGQAVRLRAAETLHSH